MIGHTFEAHDNDPITIAGNEMCRSWLASLGMDVRDVSKDPAYFNVGADLLVRDPMGQILYDVKTDQQVHTTRNIAVELIEKAPRNGYTPKVGWVHSTADVILYLDWHGKELHSIPRNDLIDLAFAKQRRGFAALHGRDGYYTLGVLIPIAEVAQYRIVEFHTQFMHR